MMATSSATTPSPLPVPPDHLFGKSNLAFFASSPTTVVYLTVMAQPRNGSALSPLTKSESPRTNAKVTGKPRPRMTLNKPTFRIPVYPRNPKSDLSLRTALETTCFLPRSVSVRFVVDSRSHMQYVLHRLVSRDVLGRKRFLNVSN